MKKYNEIMESAYYDNVLSNSETEQYFNLDTIINFNKKIGNFTITSDKIKKSYNSQLSFTLDEIIRLGETAKEIKKIALRKLTIKLDNNTVVLLGYENQKHIMLSKEYHIKDLYKCYHDLECIRDVLCDLDFYDGMTGYLNGELKTFRGLEIDNLENVQEIKR